MKTINGFDILFDFSKFIKVSDLIYFDGPLLSHYMSDKGENYLFYWVDVDEMYNKWIIIRTDIFSIQKYLDKKISLFSIITQPNDGYVYIVDIDNDINYHNIKLVSANDLPEDYIPAKDSFYTFEPSTDVDLASISQKYSSGIFEIHIKGRDVKYGSIPLHKFAPIIPNVEDIRKAMAVKYIKRIKQSANLDKEKGKNFDRRLRLDTQYDYMYSLAGSVRIILKPTQTQASFESGYSDFFAEEIIGLFQSGYNKDNITKYSELYDKNIIKKYNDFICYLNTENLSLGLKWYNYNSKTSFKQNIDYKDTKTILTNLCDFKFDGKEELELIGRFYSLNIRTGAYSFESAEGDDFKSTGHLDETRKQAAFLISFNKTYKVIIERKTVEPIGGKEKIKDTIISFVEEQESENLDQF